MDSRENRPPFGDISHRSPPALRSPYSRLSPQIVVTTSYSQRKHYPSSRNYPHLLLSTRSFSLFHFLPSTGYLSCSDGDPRPQVYHQ
ncbi:hypothetical protein BGW80DRAFT_1333214, partial [Lactifluus volemus]